MSKLTAEDRHRIDLARQLAAPDTVGDLCKAADTGDTMIALAHFWGAAKVTIQDLIAIAERLAEDGGQR